MNVSVAYKTYIHVHYEDYRDVEWVDVGFLNVKFRVKNETHVVPVRSIVSFKVTQ